jgi:hypothetical protein
LLLFYLFNLNSHLPGLFRVPGTRTDIDKMCAEFNEGKCTIICNRSLLNIRQRNFLSVCLLLDADDCEFVEKIFT